MPFKYELARAVKLDASGEAGVIVGRAEYIHSEPSYLLRYCDAAGRATETWWNESALTEGGPVYKPGEFGVAS